MTRKRWQTLTPQEQAYIAGIEDEMKLRGYSPKTRKAYRNHLLHFKRHFNDRVLHEIGAGEIRQYLLNLIIERPPAEAGGIGGRTESPYTG